MDSRNGTADGWIFPVASIVGVVGVVAIYSLVSGHNPWSSSERVAQQASSHQGPSERDPEALRPYDARRESVVAAPAAPAEVEALAREVSRLRKTVEEQSEILAKVGASANVPSPAPRAQRPAELSQPATDSTNRIAPNRSVPSAGEPNPRYNSPSQDLASAPPAKFGSAAQPPPSGREHVVQKGETLGKIAAKYGISINALRTANPTRITGLDGIRAGKALSIPLVDDADQVSRSGQGPADVAQPESSPPGQEQGSVTQPKDPLPNDRPNAATPSD